MTEFPVLTAASKAWSIYAICLFGDWAKPYERGSLSQQGIAHYGNRNWLAWIDETNLETLVPVACCADDIMVVALGREMYNSMHSVLTL
jgi:hypothetical protein